MIKSMGSSTLSVSNYIFTRVFCLCCCSSNTLEPPVEDSLNRISGDLTKVSIRIHSIQLLLFGEMSSIHEPTTLRVYKILIADYRDRNS